MNIEIVSVKDVGNNDKERIVLNVVKDTDLGDYIIATSSANPDNTISPLIKNVYWLPNQSVKAGDLVVVYRKKGKQGKIENKDGSTSYFCYWDLKETLSSKDDTTVVLFETTWTNKKVKTEIIKADEYIEE